MLKMFRDLWINSLPVDPRQRQFAYLIGILDFLGLALVFNGKTVAGLACFIAMTITAVIAHRMKKRWRDQSDDELRKE